MIRKEDVYKIGKIGKPHGVKGELSFMFSNDVFDRVDAEYLVLDIDGILVPFFITDYRFRSDETALLSLEGIDSQEKARQLTNTNVYFPRSLSDTDEGDLSWAEIAGFSLFNKSEYHPVPEKVGIIANVDDTTENILFELEDGRLIPAAEELIVEVDAKDRKIIMNIPEGLLEI
ncbi:MAG: 16S rRNA processing protein RimM [Prevotella sp.]|nr:16S rRNA processing protein RimM [Prevotella sp.]